MGILQYLSPTLQFLLAVVAFQEPFSTAQIVSFGCIWTAIAIYTVELVPGGAARQPGPGRAVRGGPVSG